MEWPWCIARLPSTRERVLDFGSGNGFLSLAAAYRGHDVVSVDLEPKQFLFETERIDYRQGDFNEMPFESESFGHVINCSSIEHVGLAGRYGSADDGDGDIRAMAKMADILRAGGTMSLAIPVGRDGVYAPWHRVYGSERLPRLLERFEIETERYWAKVQPSVWETVSREYALAEQGSASYYAVGLFVLRRS